MRLPILFVLICAPYFVCGQTAREIANNPNNFHMFENFELTKSLYANETKIVNKLKELRANLLEKQKILTKLLKNSFENGSDYYKSLLQETILALTKKLKPVKSVSADISDLSEELPNTMDYGGSIGALVRLQFAYEMNLTELSENGKIQYTTSDRELMSFETYEKLTSIDFAQLAEKATERQLYHNAIDFTKEAFRMYKNEDEVRSMKPQHLVALKKIKKALIEFNNGYLAKRQVPVDREYIIKPFMIDNKLNKKKKQPKFVVEGKYKLDEVVWRETLPADWMFMETCRYGQRYPRRFKTKVVNCRLLHHQNPYLKLGPFKEEQKSERPYAVVFHDILSDLEMNYLITESRPNLSRTRLHHNGDTQDALSAHEFKEGKKVKIVHKTVQAWLQEADYNKTHVDYLDEFFGLDINIPITTKPKTILRPLLWKLAHKIGLATQLSTNKPHSGTPMQVTNYGLGGLCEQHIDPHGYLEGKDIPPSRESLTYTGDMIGTFMAWLTDVGAGGGTSYLIPGSEGTIMPEKGAAAFWYDLNSQNHRDTTTQHGGCPVLKGSKWIMNKWMYSFENFAKFPCNVKKGLPFAQPAISHYF